MSEVAVRVFLFEHVAGGGRSRQDLPDDLASQGAGMLAAAVSDFVGAGSQVFTTLDRRVYLPSEGAVVTAVSPGDAMLPVFDNLASRCEAGLVIAPESDGLLEQWLVRLKHLQVPSLGCDPKAVNLCADKLKLAHHFTQLGLPTPVTAAFRSGQTGCFPAIVKPRFGAGCQDTYLCMGPTDAHRIPKSGDWIIQPWSSGHGALAVSVSLLIHGQDVTPLLVGQQKINVDNAVPQRLRYAGGIMPLDGPRHLRAIHLACEAVSSVPGMHGFIGVDLILAERPADDKVIEINPRLTVSYVVLQQFCKTHLATAMLANDATVDRCCAQAVRRACSGKRIRFDASGRMAASRPANQ